MISSVQIDGYRGFERFEMSDLGRINLLVGANNCGKTSVLEALHLLTSRGDPVALWQLLWRRGERIPGVANPRRPDAELDVCHLFTGHETHPGSRLVISAKNQSPERTLSLMIVELSGKERNELAASGEHIPIPRLALQIKGTPVPPVALLPLTRSGGISTDTFDATPRRARRRATEENPSQFITTESLDSDDLVSLWDKVALTSNEDLVLRALKFLDPDIQRIASQATTQGYYAAVRGGFIIKRRGHEHPIPIGSMGDGMWRMMAMSIAITQCKGGVLLVDEIDTGLHYTVMSDMWKLIFGAARELDVQVFATTHSSDCIKSLSEACVGELFDAGNKVTVQRIESGKSAAVPYTQREIEMATERMIEVR
jgi:hypothetical protein